MRGLCVTARYCAGQTRMYTFLYPYMGIVPRDNVHRVKVTARVSRACIYPYMGIMYTHVTMYIHNVRVTARVIYSTYIRPRISYPFMGTVKSCEELYTMSRLLRGSDAHEHILLSIYGYHVYSGDNVYSQC